MLLLISSACAFLIFLDHNKSRDIKKSIIYVVVLFVVMLVFAFGLKILKFKLLYAVIIAPVVLFGTLLFKNRNNTVDNSNEDIENKGGDQLDSF